MAVFDLDPARAVIIIVADGSYTGVIGSFAYIEVASSPDVGIGQCEVRIGGNREGVKVALCGGVKGACATAAGAEGKLDLSALGNLKAAARVDAFYVIVELVALLRVCRYGDQSAVGADFEIAARVDTLRPRVDKASAALLGGVVIEVGGGQRVGRNVESLVVVVIDDLVEDVVHRAETLEHFGCCVLVLGKGRFVFIDGDDVVVDLILLHLFGHIVENVDREEVEDRMLLHRGDLVVDAFDDLVVVRRFGVAVLVFVSGNHSVEQIGGELRVAVLVVVGAALALEEAEHRVEIRLQGADVAHGIADDLFVRLFKTLA